MAFVFRSQKESVFDVKRQHGLSSKTFQLSSQQSQLNGTRYTNSPQNHSSNISSKLMKGLPSLLKKQKNIQPGSFQHNNQNHSQKLEKLDDIKVNQKKLKKTTQNYFFTSNISRDIYQNSSKLLDKSLTYSQFNIFTNQQIPIQDQKKYQITNYIASNSVVNKNLIEVQKMKLNQKPQDQNTEKYRLNNKILVDCFKFNEKQIKRKNSPPLAFDKNQVIQVLTKANFQKQKIDRNDSNMQGSLQMQFSFKKTLNSVKKSQTEKKLMKLQKGNLQNSFYKQSESQHQQQDDKVQRDTPGPGSYDNTINLKQKKSFRSRKEKFSKIFFSPLQRFESQHVKFHQITYVNEQKPQKVYKNLVFLSRTPKFIENQKKNTSPQPGYYNPRISLQHDIVHNLLRSVNIARFNSTQQRFVYKSQNKTPGPGHYEADCLQKAKIEQIKNQMSSFYKSKVQRCLDYCKTDTVKNNKQNSIKFLGLRPKLHEKLVIHKRQEHFDSSQFFSPPPFMSGVDRFKQLHGYEDDGVTREKFRSKSPQKQSKHNQPFNSSEQRKLSSSVGQGVGVGSYLVDKQTWSKKSYNVFFN